MELILDERALMQGLCCSAGSGAGDQEPEQKSRACQRSPVSSPLPRLSPSVPGPETHRSPSGKRWKRPAQDRQAGSQPRTVDLHFKGGMGFNLHMVSSRQWLNTSPLCLLAHPDRHGVILVVNKDSLLFDGGGGQEATSSAVVSVADSAGFLVAAGGGSAPTWLQ